MKIAFFDTKPYDIPGFDHYLAGTGMQIKYYETHLNEDTVSLAAGFDAVCVCVCQRHRKRNRGQQAVRNGCKGHCSALRRL